MIVLIKAALYNWQHAAVHATMTENKIIIVRTHLDLSKPNSDAHHPFSQS